MALITSDTTIARSDECGTEETTMQVDQTGLHHLFGAAVSNNDDHAANVDCGRRGWWSAIAVADRWAFPGSSHVNEI